MGYLETAFQKSHVSSDASVLEDLGPHFRISDLAFLHLCGCLKVTAAACSNGNGTGGVTMFDELILQKKWLK